MPVPKHTQLTPKQQAVALQLLNRLQDEYEDLMEDMEDLEMELLEKKHTMTLKKTLEDISTIQDS